MAVLVLEDFEGTGTPSGWSTYGTGIDFDYSTSPAPLSGSESLYINGAWNEVYAPSFSAKSFVSIKFEFYKPSGLPTSTDEILHIRGSSFIQGYVFVQSTGRIGCRHGTVWDYGSAASVLTDDAKNYIWVDFTVGTGSDGDLKVYISPTDLKPVAPQVHITTGTATLDIDTISLFRSNGGMDHIFDNLQVADEVIDPILGNELYSGGYDTIVNSDVYCIKFTAASNMDINYVGFYGRSVSGSISAKGLIFDSSGDLVSNGISQVSVINSTFGTWALTFATPPECVSGQDYYFGLIINSALGMRLYYDDSNTYDCYFDDSNSYSSPQSIGTPSLLGEKYCLFINYTDQGTSSNELDVADLSQENALDSIGLSQLHILELQNLSNGHTLDGIQLDQGYDLSVDGLDASQSLDSVQIDQLHALSVDGLDSSQSLDSVQIDQLHVLSVDGLDSSQSLDGVQIDQLHVLSVDGLDASQSLDGVQIDQLHVLSVDGLDASQSLDGVQIDQLHVLSADGLDASQSLDNIKLSLAEALSVDGLDSSQTLDSIQINQLHNLSVDSLDGSQSLDSVQIDQIHNLSVDGLDASQSLDGVQIDQIHGLSVDSLDSSQSLDSVQIGQLHVIAVNDLDNTNTLDGISIQQQHVLTIADVSNDNTLDSIAIDQFHVLTIEGLSSDNTLDNIVLITSWAQGAVVINIDVLKPQMDAECLKPQIEAETIKPQMAAVRY